MHKSHYRQYLARRKQDMATDNKSPGQQQGLSPKMAGRISTALRARLLMKPKLRASKVTKNVSSKPTVQKQAPAKQCGKGRKSEKSGGNTAGGNSNNGGGGDKVTTTIATGPKSTTITRKIVSTKQKIPTTTMTPYLEDGAGLMPNTLTLKFCPG